MFNEGCCKGHLSYQWKPLHLRGSSPCSKDGWSSYWISSGFLKESQRQVPIQKTTSTGLHIATDMHKPLSRTAYYFPVELRQEPWCGDAKLLQTLSILGTEHHLQQSLLCHSCRIREQTLSMTKNLGRKRNVITTAICKGMWDLKLEVSFSS